MIGRVLQRRNWWDQVEPHILLGALPFRRDVARLAALKVTGVVNMCKEYPGPKDLYLQHHIEQLWLPTVDFNPPSLEHVVAGVEFIDRHVKQGGKVYIHCKAGRARSATIVMCYLMKHHGLSASQAQAKLVQSRPHVHPKLDQRRVVLDYESQYVRRS